MAVLPYESLARRVLTDLSAGNCAALVGLSNTGKSTLMRALAGQSAERIYAKLCGRKVVLIYVDCNRAVAISAQGFYEVVLRSLLEALADQVALDVTATLRGHHQEVTDAATAFNASLSFNLALTDLCEQLKRDLVLLIDEFDELYTTLDDRALLNLRALRDRFKDRLGYVTATVRALPALRGASVEDEFAEMFAQSTYPMPPLDEDEARQILGSLNLANLSTKRVATCLELAGGHMGLLVAAAQVVAGMETDQLGEALAVVGQEPTPRAECLKIWNQLTPEEQEAIVCLVVEPSSSLPPQQLEHLEALGLVREGWLFSPMFEAFVMRRQRGPETAEAGVRLDPDSGDVWVDEVRIPVLTDLEYKLLQLLHERRDKLTDKYQIVTAVWGEGYLDEIDDARVEKLVSRLRSKIEQDPAAPRYLITQRGRGYKLLSRPKAE
ncbi:MAG: winged helix-turn-helix domain-containing protein [Chloroflexi bacterium]|nr:winged helix-turn-helix domain-containing protein [Chloroflexota bacterium]